MEIAHHQLVREFDEMLTTRTGALLPAGSTTPAPQTVLRPDPDQRQRLLDIRDNLINRIAEAEREGWLGEVEGLRSLSAAEDKIAQLDRMISHRATSVDLGMPTFTQIAAAINSRAAGPDAVS